MAAFLVDIFVLVFFVRIIALVSSDKVVCIRQEDKTKRRTTNKGKKQKNRHK